MKRKILIILCAIIVSGGSISFGLYQYAHQKDTSKQTISSAQETGEDNSVKDKTSTKADAEPRKKDDRQGDNSTTDTQTSDQEDVTANDAKASSNANSDTTTETTTDLSASASDNATAPSDASLSAEEYAQMVATEEAELQSIEANINAQNQAALASGADTLHYDNGRFSYPSSYRGSISSDYGYRIHPISGVQQFHNGIDYALTGGSPILAAYRGQVAATGTSSVMGNYIVLYHGDGLYSIYMHASSVRVSAGQWVESGSYIGDVGSTGLSTGNHLHFSIRLNGNFVSPWNYL